MYKRKTLKRAITAKEKSCMGIPEQPKNFARVIVKRWLKNNAHRFSHPPRIVDVRKNGFCLKFKGITPQIVLSIHHGWALEVWASDDKDNYFDILTEFDLSAERDAAGRYYCDCCAEEQRTFYASLGELWEKHSLEPMLVWANEVLRAESWLCLYGKPRHSTWAELVTAENVPNCRSDKSFYAAYPVEMR